MKNSGNTISIITPTLNQGPFIEETIRSVVSQEGDFYIDYIIIDGGSSDGSVDIIKRYADAAESMDIKCLGLSVRWGSKKDRGQTDAINKGICMAEGGVVAWINSDDYYLRGTFKRVMDFFSRNPRADFFYGDGLVIDEKGRTLWEWLSRPYSLRALTTYQFALNRFGYYLMQPSTFWRIGVHEKVGNLDVSMEYAMDAEFFIKAGAAGVKFVHVPVKLSAFRMIKGTKSMSSETVFWPDMVEIMRRYGSYKDMSRLLSYYFFNEGISHGREYRRLDSLRKALLTRWEGLPQEELARLSEQSARGLKVAVLMLDKKASASKTAVMIDRIKKRLLHYYAFRYDYRYLFSRLHRILRADKPLNEDS